VIGTVRVSGLALCGSLTTGRYGVRRLWFQIDFSDYVVLDYYMVFPKLNFRSSIP